MPPKTRGGQPQSGWQGDDRPKQAWLSATGATATRRPSSRPERSRSAAFRGLAPTDALGQKSALSASMYLSDPTHTRADPNVISLGVRLCSTRPQRQRPSLSLPNPAEKGVRALTLRRKRRLSVLQVIKTDMVLPRIWIFQSKIWQARGRMKESSFQHEMHVA